MWHLLIKSIIHFLSNFPHGMATFLLAMSPIAEIRLSLPVAIFSYHLPVWEAILLSVVGNMIPTTIILIFADSFHHWVEKQSGLFLGKAWANHLLKIQKQFAKYEKYGLLGLSAFIAISLPGTGSYTAALIAFVLGIPYKKSWPYIFAGVVGSALVVSFVLLGVDRIF